MNESVTNEEAQDKEKTEFKNDHAHVMVDRQPGCKIKLDITVTPQATQAAYNKAIKAINKEVSLPGFRKGKAPEAMIVKNYASYVDQEWKEILVQTAFKEAMALTKIYPLNEETIQKPQVKKTSQEEGAEIVIEFEASPQLPEISPKELKLSPVERREVTEEEVDESIENIRLHHATWEEVTDRAVQEGDYIDIDIENLDSPGDFLCKDTRFEVVPGKMGNWMRNLVIGKNVNDTAEGMSERSEELDPKAEFKPTHCKITIKAIKKAKLPEVDEELAKKVGVETAEELTEKVLQNLNNQAEEEVKQKLRDQLEETLLERYPFDIPSSLVTREKKNRLDFAKRDLQKAGKSDEEISRHLEEMEKDLDEKVNRAFRMFFIARHIADENKITVTQEELVRELMLQMYTQASPIDTSLDPEEARSKVYINLLSLKVKDFLIDQATIE